jgi:hypothetical protein
MNQAESKDALPAFHRADNFLYDCPAQYADDSTDSDRGFVASLRILCGGKLFFKPSWADSVSSVRQLILQTATIPDHSKMLLVDAPYESSSWWDFPYLSFKVKIQSDVPQWWPCHWNLVFPVDNSTFLLPVCGLIPGQQAFIKIFAFDLKGKMLSKDPVFQRSWDSQLGFPIVNVFPMAGRSVLAVQRVNASLRDVHQITTSLFAFHGPSAVAMLTYDAHFQSQADPDCSAPQDRPGETRCWAEVRFVEPDFDASFDASSRLGGFSLQWRLSQGNLLRSGASIPLVFNDKTWALAASDAGLLVSDESTLGAFKASLSTRGPAAHVPGAPTPVAVDP